MIAEIFLRIFQLLIIDIYAVCFELFSEIRVVIIKMLLISERTCTFREKHEVVVRVVASCYFLYQM